MNFSSTKSNQRHPRKAPASRRMFMIRKRSFRISEKRFRGSGWALRGQHRPAEESNYKTRCATTSKYQVRFMSRISPGRTHPDKSRGLSLSLRECFQPLLLGFAVHECANFQIQFSSLGIEGAEGERPVVDPGHRDDFGIVSRRKISSTAKKSL